MNHVIVFEGPDNLGKTTLINQLCETTQDVFCKFHFGAVKNITEAKKVMFTTLDDLAKVKNQRFIFDRSPFGDMVYGYYRKYDPYLYWDQVKLRMNKLDTKFLFIVFQADPLTYMQFNIEPKGDEKKKYQKRIESKIQSERFAIMANKVVNDCENASAMLVDCNNYETLDDRNRIILRVIDRWLNGDMLVRMITD